jgi:hypothetical protein
MVLRDFFSVSYLSFCNDRTLKLRVSEKKILNVVASIWT